MDPTPRSLFDDDRTNPGNAPFEASFISRAFVRPDVAIDLVLAEPARFSATLDSSRRGRLIAATAFVAIVFAVPFGLYFGATKALHVSALFVGSVAICYPSLHVFATYVGKPLDLAQSAALALLAAAVASTFSLGFAPIIFFLRGTIAGDGESASMSSIVDALLSVALVAGMVQVVRCLRSKSPASHSASFGFVLYGWFVLLAFIALRMHRALGLAG